MGKKYVINELVEQYSSIDLLSCLCFKTKYRRRLNAAPGVGLPYTHTPASPPHTAPHPTQTKRRRRRRRKRRRRRRNKPKNPPQTKQNKPNPPKNKTKHKAQTQPTTKNIIITGLPEIIMSRFQALAKSTYVKHWCFNCAVFVTPVPHPPKVAQGAKLIKIHVSRSYL